MRKDSMASSEHGFSLVAVLAIMSVVMVSVLLISQAKVRQQRVQKAIKVKQSYADVNQALINNVVEVFHKEMVNTCVVPKTALAAQDLDGTADFKWEQSIKNTDAPGIVLPTTHEAALRRCRQPVGPSSGISTTADKNRFYFCIQINQARTNNTAPKDSILGATYAFAEFAVELIDLQTQAALNCTDYTTRKNDVIGVPPLSRDGSAGMAVTMALYWANKSGGTYTYSQKALSYIANQN